MLWLWPLQEPRRVRSRFIRIWKFRIYFYCIILKLKRVFPLLFSQRTHQTTYIPLRMTTTSKVQSEHTQSLHLIDIREFFTCLSCILPFKFHFATLDKLHFITYLTALSDTTKKMHMKLYATDSEFSTHFPAFWIFLRTKFAFSYLGINPIAC